jgi:hypothetical protein
MKPGIPGPSDRDQMLRFRGEILRNVDAAVQLCAKIHKESGGQCGLGTNCPFHAAFRPHAPFGCEVSGIEQVLGVAETVQEIGRCPHQVENNDCAIYPDQCQFQTDDGKCGREAAALALAEAPDKLPDEDPGFIIEAEIPPAMPEGGMDVMR